MRSASPLSPGVVSRRLRSILFVFGITLATHSAFAATVILTPTKDDTLYEDTEGDVSNGQGAYLFAGKTGVNDGYHLRRGLLAFDIAAAIPAGATITDVALTMFMSRSSPNPAPVNITLHLALSDWGEGGSNAGSPGGSGAPAQAGDATWVYNFYNTSRWTNVGGDFKATASATTAVSTQNKTYTWVGGSLVGDVQAWVNNPGTNFGWFIRGDELTDESAQRFNSGENSSNVPQLTITYTIPEPSSIALCVVGSAFCLQRRRNGFSNKSRNLAL